jgi:Uma2 family endonuclease
MIAAGIIHEDARIELILGQMFNRAAKSPRHTFSTTRLLRELTRLIEQGAIVRCQEPITLPNNSEPEPDISIARYHLVTRLDRVAPISRD